jgi:LuxR family transcriptional regulator, maltose regulon positive regulatory protein
MSVREPESPGSPVPRKSAARGRKRTPTSRRASLAPRPSLDVIQAKIRPPALPPGTVSRGTLVNRLRREAAPAVTVVAPAGYGKTTLLAQWAAAESRPVAWLSLDARDSEPLTLLKHLVATFEGVAPLDDRLLTAFAAPRRPDWARLAARVVHAFGASRLPVLIVLDDVDLLHSKEARAVLSMLLARTPRGGTVALGSRSPPPVPVAALRAHGSAKELDVDDLRLSGRDAELLLRNANDALSDEEITGLIEACDGWPVALYLAGISLRDEPAERRSAGVSGWDRFLADYMRAEYFAQLRPHDLAFLRRTSILDDLTPPLCDAVLEAIGSELELKRLARAQLVSPQDADWNRYRVHRLVQQFLRHELAMEEPELIPILHRRAADWYEAVGDPESALQYANAAGDAARVAAIITAVAIPASTRGRVVEIEEALARFEGARLLERYPAVAAHAARIHAFRGRAADAERCLAFAERGLRGRGRDITVLRGRVAVVRAALCRAGVRKMWADAGDALVALVPTGPWYPAAVHLRGSAALLLGAADEADALLTEAAHAAEVVDYFETRMIALSQLSLLARERGATDRADALSAEARAIQREAALDDYPTAAITLAAAAQTAVRHGRWAEARELVATTDPLRPHLNEALPWLAVATRLELARCCLGLRDVETAHALLAEIDAILVVRPRLGVLTARARAAALELAKLPGAEAVGTGLTPAELRLLPLLATHLSFREIAEELHVSRNTVKTQAISIYRKLGVSGRSQAIAAASGSRSPEAA